MRQPPTTTAGALARILLFLFFLATSPLQAERLPVRIYTSADGMGTSAAMSLARDPRGFIWLCSRDGLVRFDGYRFITYRIGNGEADPAVFTLLPTRKGVYWINLNRGTDYRFIDRGDATPLQPMQQQQSPNDPRIPLVNVDAITGSLRLPSFEDNAGNLWAWDLKGIDMLREVNGEMTSQLTELRLPGNPSEKFSSISFAEGTGGSFWVGTSWGLVRHLPNGKIVHFSVKPENNIDLVRYYAEDNSSHVWIARPDGLLVLKVDSVAAMMAGADFSSQKIIIKPGKVADDGSAELPSQPGEAFIFPFADILLRERKTTGDKQDTNPAAIYGLVAAVDGSIWIAGSRGLIGFDGRRFHHYTERQGLASDAIGSIVADAEGNIWLSAYAGLMRLNPKGLITYDSNDGLVEKRIHSISEDAHGDLYVVADNWNISHRRGDSFVTARPAIGAGDVLLWHSTVAMLDSHGDWWALTNKKLYRYSGVRRVEDLQDRQPTATYTDQNGLISNDTSILFEDSKGNIWISNDAAAKQHGLVLWERATGQFHRFPPKENELPDTYIPAITEDKAGTIWLGHETGLVRYRDGHFSAVEPADNLPTRGVTNMFVDSKARLWIASSLEGLIRVDDPTASRPTFRRYTIADGLTSNNVRCITEDFFGNIYVGTVRGINRLNPETGRMKYFGTGDGLAGDFVSVAHRDRTGAIWFGTYSGLSKMIPEPDRPAPAPPVLISALRVAGVDYSLSPLGQTAVAAPEQTATNNNLQVDFFSISPSGNDGVRYQYRLAGSGQDWGPATTQRSVTFADVRPGSYRFEVRAINADGIASANPAYVTFRVLPPVWQRWWFLTLVALLIIGFAYALHRYRLVQLLKVERMRTRIATDLHDDIGASLSRMAILSEVVKQQTVGNGNHTGPLLNEIAESARSLVDSMGDIVWSIDPRRDDLQSVVRRIRQFASDVLEAKGINWEFQVSPEVESLKLDPEQRQHLFLVFKEAINNVVRHGNSTRFVSLKIMVQGQQLVGEIKDDGCGFSPQAPSEDRSQGRGGNGLPNMRERAAQLRGRLEIASAPGAGTTILLKVPMK